MSDTTSISLLDRLRSQPDEAAWQRLLDLYTPLLRRWLRSLAVQANEADDFVQEVLVVLLKELRGFQHDGRPGAFRAWLRQILVNRVRASWRKRKPTGGALDFEKHLAQLEDPGSEQSRIWEEEHDRLVLDRLLKLLEPEFSPITWQAFRSMTLEGKQATVVAAELGISRATVFRYKADVLRRLRQEAQGLVD
jgi:RNA polymerase sigma-70 factor (ECF subfamily)